jgi:hypothetical protein
MGQAPSVSPAERRKPEEQQHGRRTPPYSNSRFGGVCSRPTRPTAMSAAK